MADSQSEMPVEAGDKSLEATPCAGEDPVRRSARDRVPNRRDYDEIMEEQIRSARASRSSYLGKLSSVYALLDIHFAGDANFDTILDLQLKVGRLWKSYSQAHSSLLSALGALGDPDCMTEEQTVFESECLRKLSYDKLIEDYLGRAKECHDDIRLSSGNSGMGSKVIDMLSTSTSVMLDSRARDAKQQAVKLALVQKQAEDRKRRELARAELEIKRNELELMKLKIEEEYAETKQQAELAQLQTEMTEGMIDAGRPETKVSGLCNASADHTWNFLDSKVPRSPVSTYVTNAGLATRSAMDPPIPNSTVPSIPVLDYGNSRFPTPVISPTVPRMPPRLQPHPRMNPLAGTAVHPDVNIWSPQHNPYSDLFGLGSSPESPPVFPQVNTSFARSPSVHWLDGYQSSSAQHTYSTPDPNQQWMRMGSSEPVNMYSAMASAIQQVALEKELPPTEIKKFEGDSAEYPRFRTRFYQLVESKSMSDEWKMTRLLQFVDGRAKKAIQGLEGLGGSGVNALKESLRILETRFGQPHMITDACINSVITGPTILPHEKQALQEFADTLKTTHKTLQMVNCLDEVNSKMLQQLVRRLPFRDQSKWLESVKKIRESGRKPTFHDLVIFVSDRAEAMNDPLFGNIGTESPNPKRLNRKSPSQKPKFSSTPTMHALASQVENQSNSNNVKGEKTTQDKGGRTKTDCSDCNEGKHQLWNCAKFREKSVKDRKLTARSIKACFNCLSKSHFVGQCTSESTCKVEGCGQRHHTLLHIQDNSRGVTPSEASKEEPLESRYSVRSGGSGSVAIQVVPVCVEGKDVSVKRLCAH